MCESLRKQYPRYSNFFLDYEKIEQEVAACAPVDVLASHLRNELDKVNDIVDLEWEVLSRALKLNLRHKSVEDCASLDTLAEEVLGLASFVDANYAGFGAAVRRCNEMQTADYNWFLARVDAAAFRHCNFDAALGQLGELYARWRNQHPETEEPAPAGEVQTFFVPADKVMRVKAAILRHSRPDVHGARTEMGPSYWRLDQSASFDFRRPVTHVYFENGQGEQYTERLMQRTVRPSSTQAGSMILFRCRWVGLNTKELENRPEVEVHVDVDSADTVDIVLEQKNLAAFITGSLDPTAASSRRGQPLDAAQQRALASVSASIVAHGLQPRLSAAFSRSTFVCDAADASAGPVLTLDEELSFRDEFAPQGKDIWCCAMSEVGTDVEGLPGAILRVRPRSQGLSASLLESLAALRLQPVPGFSKALHGMVLLHPAQAVPLPPWCPKSASVGAVMGASLMAAQASDAGVTATPAPSTAAPPKNKPDKAAQKPKPAAPPPPPIGVMSRLCSIFGEPEDKDLTIDSKTPMANERTLLRWLRSAVLLSGLSAFLSASKQQAAQINGMFLSFLALIFTLAPLWSYWVRSKEISSAKPSQPQQDYFLQQMLGWSLIVVLSLTLSVDWAARTER